MTAARSFPGAAPLLQAALAAAQRGWPVFPLTPGGKRPAVKDWETTATLDPAVLTRWWHHRPYNVAIPCGPAGLLVLDLDAGHTDPPTDLAAAGVHHGTGVLALLAARAGVPDATDTFTVATPRGEHRYFTAPDPPLRSTTGRLGWAIDTRGAGGYVVAAGSILTIRGQRHHYIVQDPRPTRPLPDWLADALTARWQRAVRRQPDLPAGVVVAEGRVAAYVAAAVAGEAHNVAAAKVGTRNHTLFVAAARLGGLVSAGALDGATAAAALEDAARRHIGIDEFTADEARRTIANGLRHGAREPRQLRPPGVPARPATLAPRPPPAG